MFSSVSRRRVVVLLVLTCLLLITLDRHDNPVISRVRRGVAVVMEPFDTAARVMWNPVTRAWNSYTHYDDLQRENERLRDQLEYQRGAEAVAVANQLQLNDLLALNRLTALGGYRSVISKVVGNAPGNFQNTVEINVGARDGIAVGMPVTDGAGLVGRITRVKPSSSIVLLITDPAYHVSAEVLMASRDVDGGDVGDGPVAACPDDVLNPVPVVPTDPSVDDPSGDDPTAGDPSDTGDDPTADDPGDDPGDDDVNGDDPSGGDTTDDSAASTSADDTDPLAVIRETGTLSGQAGDRPLLLTNVDSMSGLLSLCIGAPVSTAGGAGSLAPQGIPIGRVSGVERSNETGGRAPVVEVEPYANLRQLNFLAVVLFVPNDGTVG